MSGTIFIPDLDWSAMGNSGLKVVFVVGSTQEEGVVRSAGHEAVAFRGGCFDDVAAESIGRDGVSFALMLDHESLREATEAAESIGLLTFVADGGAWARVVKCGKHDAKSFLDEQAAQALNATYDQTMARLHVDNPCDVVESIAGLIDCGDTIPTHLQQIDGMLDGGLPSMGLVVLGAQSSYGKTTLAVQVADNIACDERPVLFVTVEQGQRELVCKSLSRHMMLNHGIRYASFDLVRPKKRNSAEWGQAHEKAFTEACLWYETSVAKHLRFQSAENGIRPTVKDIGRVAECMRWRFGESPVIFIDYLQLLAAPVAEGGRQISEKEAIDANITALRQMARKLNTCIVVISSMNRASYGDGATLSSLKESGGIEYGADVVMFITSAAEAVEATGTDAARKATAKKRDEEYREEDQRRAMIWVIKNRNGIGRGKRTCLYDAKANLFKSDDGFIKRQRAV